MNRFDRDTAVEPQGEGRFDCTISPGWVVERGPNGGYVSALLLRAIGTFTCLYSIFDIYWDILASQGAAAGLNDAVAFSQLTGAEPQVVGVAWLTVCLVFFLLVLKNVLQEDDEVPVPVEVPKEHEGFNLPAV